MAEEEVKSPVVTVVIPTFKHCEFVVETLESVLGQSYRDLEVIVVNDGSPDGTTAALRPYAVSGRIRYVEQENLGQAAARNKGISLARGEFIALLDDDDLWPADRTYRLVKLLKEDPSAVVAYGQAEVFGLDEFVFPLTKAPDGEVLEAFVDTGWIRSPGQALIRASALHQVGGLDESIWGTDDWDLWLGLAERGKFRYLQAVTLRYRAHASNASHNFVRMYQNGMKVVNKHFPSGRSQQDNSRRHRASEFVRRFTSGDGLGKARRDALSGRRFRAITAIAQAVAIRPAMLFDRKAVKAIMQITHLCISLRHGLNVN